MILEKRKISELSPAEYNPRKRLTPEDEEYQKIKSSIEHFGYVDPIIINSDGTIIGGHQRANVLSDLGYEEIDVVVVDLNKDDEKALNIALNKITGEWDEIKLKEVLLELSLGDYDFTVTGFNQEELDDLVQLTEFEPETTEDEFDVEQALEETSPIVKQGEIWQLGRHRLMCGDSTDLVHVQKLMNGELADLVITDPPYNVNYEEKAEALNVWRPNKNGAMHIKNDTMSNEAFYSFLFKVYNNLVEIMRPGAAIYVFHADMEGLNFRKAYVDAGLKLHECLIWEKNNFVLGNNDYHWRHEPILYGWKEGAAHYFIDDRTQDTVILEDDVDFDAMKKPELIQYIKDLIGRYTDQTSVLYEKKSLSSALHPTMKPLELIGRLMKNSSKKNWKVVDLFGGSGSTLMTAEQLERTAFVMELSEEYASVIIKRWEEYTGRKAVRLE